MNRSYLIVISFLFSLLACQPSSPTLISIAEKNLIPEGIAYHKKSNTFFLSSVHQAKIIRVNPDGSFSNFIQPHQYDYRSGVGLLVDEEKDCLYAIGGLPLPPFRSILLALDINSGQLLDSWTIEGPNRPFLNDMALDKQGQLYLTSSTENALYQLTPQADSLRLFLQDEAIEWPNGICISDDNTKLYIASYTKGIRVLDLATKTFVNAPDTSGVSGKLDGLKFYNNSLIGIQNGEANIEKHCILRYYLNPTGTAIIKTDTIDQNHPKFNVPTTAVIVNNSLFCIANSQLDNLDQEKNIIKDSTQLDPTYILKYPL